MKQFNFETIDDFDYHISKSIHGYNLLHELIINISSFFIKKNDTVFDLGTTTGMLPIKLNERYNCNVIGYDITGVNFLCPSEQNVKLIKTDLTKINLQESNLFFSVFTLQFLSVKERIKLIKKVYDALNIKGAFIVCEKEYSESALTQEIFTFCNYQNKLKTFNTDDVLGKEAELRHSMNCLTEVENIKLFKDAGFKVDVFFKSLNFKGYILIK
jgi:tRNA (cmo5U34)-methyltransferase